MSTWTPVPPPGLPTGVWIDVPSCGCDSSGMIPPSYLQKAFTLYYAATAGQRAFNLSIADHYGSTYVLDTAAVLAVTAGGNRLALDDGTGFGGYTVNVPSNSVNLVSPAGAGEQIIIDIFYEQEIDIVETTNSVVTEKCNVTALNTFAPLANVPDGGAVTLFVNGRAFTPIDTPPVFTVLGNQITWVSTIYSVQTTDNAVIEYTYGGQGGSGGASIVAPVTSVAGKTGAVTLVHTDITDWASAASSFGGGISDAPNDGTLYGRKNAAWTAVPSGGIADAPNDANAYLRSGLAWTSSGTISGSLTVNGAFGLQRSSYASATVPLNGAVTLLWTAGEVQKCSLTANSTIAVTGWPASGMWARIILDITNTGAFAITAWPSGTIWPGGTAPVITSGAGKRDVIILMTLDGGTTVLGSIAGQNYS